MTSGILVCAVTRGTASPECISDSTRASRLPSFPPGCRLAKSSSLNPRFSESATASASPRASMVVVEAVGASPSEQASLEIEQSKATSAAEARVEGAPAREGLRDIVAGHSDERNLQPLDRGHQLQNFFRLAAGRKRQHDIAAHDHPQIAMQRLHRMQVERRRASRT